MAAFFLTQDNITFVKHALRAPLPTVKSSHRAEAFAAAAGYRTHAALLAELKQSEADRPRIGRIEHTRFAARIADLGYGTVNGKSLIEIVRSPDMPHPAWSEYSKGDSEANADWFWTCRTRNIPMVHIVRRRKYVELNWDCMSIEPVDEGHVRGKQANALAMEMFRRFQSLVRQDPGRSEFLGKAFVGSVDRLLPEIARDLADELFMLLYAPMRVRAAA